MEEKTKTIETIDEQIPEVGKVVDISLVEKFKEKYFVYDKILVWKPDPQNEVFADDSKYLPIKEEMTKEWIPDDYINTVIIDDYNYNN